MLFRDQHDSGKVAGAVGAGLANQHNDDDETSSTGGRSYTSAESAAAQSFEQRMAQLNNATHMMPDSRSGSDIFCKEDSGIGGGAHAYLTPGYQLFSKVGGAYDDTDTDDIDDVQRSLSLMAQANEDDGIGPRCAERTSTPSGRRRSSLLKNDDDEEEADYLATLLSNIERHAERLDTQFYRYPPSDVIKQQMAVAAPPKEGKTKASAAALAKSATTGGPGSATTSAKEDDAHENQSGSGSALSPRSASQAPTAGSSTAPSPTVAAAPAPSQGSGTKLFLGGLRYEVIQSGRHMVSWIFQVACGVHLSPSSILIHRKTKNGRSNVAPTGCASVFVASEADVQALLDVNQRIYCAEEGVYVSPSPEIMKELIASKDIVDVTGGRVRGPTHPVVIERAYSFSHHHGHRECGGSGSRGQGGAGGGGALAGSGGGHRHGRTTSSASTESNLSAQLRGPLPPPYGSVPPPQYGSTPGSPSVMPGSLPPPSYAPSSLSSSMAMSGASLDGSLRRRASSAALYSFSAVLSGQSSPSQQPVLGDALVPSPMFVPKALDPPRVTFHAYLRGDGVPHGSAAVPQPSGLPSTAGVSAPHHTVLFVAALPTEATPDYVSWLFSLMSIALHPSQIHIIGGGDSSSSNPNASGSPGEASPVGSAKGKAESCATVHLGESDTPIALNYHHRVLCTLRGAWIGHSAQDMAALRASDASLHDCPLLHVDRRMSVQPVAGVGNCDPATTEIPGYPHGVSGGDLGSAGAAPYPPTPASYSTPVFGGMPMMPATNIGGAASTIPLSMQWGFNMPSSFPNCMHTGVPPPPPAGMMGARAPPLPPPPFPFPQTVTIGDRIYQLPPGSTVQFVPVITPASGTGAYGEAEAGTGSASGGHRRSGPPGPGSTAQMEVAEKPSSGSPHLDIALQFSTRPSQKHAEP
ncbi:hypothetical protein LSCM1_02720 [Leishmania martiniquensis]|uniref:Uncharacterized protein n=1 Tax=Leishmania martiniquensis TaxID=1580590 RepID=A0A836H3V6_9TRYP|nr:hypothetical protein LSCM1_02720 [Leishmania martiniquensis]